MGERQPCVNPNQMQNPLEAFSCGSVGKESICNVGDLGSIPGLGRPPGEGKGNPCQYFYLENLMEREEPGRLQSMGSQRVGQD